MGANQGLALQELRRCEAKVGQLAPEKRRKRWELET